MIEHSHGNDGYLAGGGNHPDRFVRDGAPKPGITADATSTIIDENGHWLGGRLCVELVLEEVSQIFKEAKKIPPPADGGADWVIKLAPSGRRTLVPSAVYCEH